MVNIKEFNSWCLLIGLDNKDIKELSELFTYEIPGAYFMKGPNWLKYKCLLEPSKTPGWYKFPTGLMYKIKHFLQDKNIPYEVEDCREKPKTKKYFSFQSSFKNPEMRYYQKEIIDKSEIYSRGVIEAATGCGKSLIMVNLIKKLSLKTLVVVPSLSILDQFYDLLLNAFGKRMVGKISSKKAELDKEINKLAAIVEADEIADILKVTRQTVIRWANEGLLPLFHPADRTMRFLKEDVRKFIKDSYGRKAE